MRPKRPLIDLKMLLIDLKRSHNMDLKRRFTDLKGPIYGPKKASNGLREVSYRPKERGLI